MNKEVIDLHHWLTPRIEKILKLHDTFLSAFPDRKDENDEDLKLSIRAGIVDILMEFGLLKPPNTNKTSTLIISEEGRGLVSAFMGEEYPPKIDFNLLMPAYTKAVKYLEEIEPTIEFDSAQHELLFGFDSIYGNLHKIVDGDIEVIWNSIIEFIRWYNKKNKP
jgi:hypothetical protein